MNILSIKVLRSKNSCDKLIIDLDVPNGCWPYQGNAYATMDVASLHGEEYAKKHFPDTLVEVINMD